MTRAEFIEAFKHELAGFVLDASTCNRTGGELALWLRMVMKRIDAKLGQMYDALRVEPVVPQNGKPPAAPAAPTTARKP